MYKTHISTSPDYGTNTFTQEIISAGSTAFGDKSDAFADHVIKKFSVADIHQIIPYDQAIAGFALYYRLPDSGLYIDGIAINSKYQAKKRPCKISSE